MSKKLPIEKQIANAEANQIRAMQTQKRWMAVLNSIMDRTIKLGGKIATARKKYYAALERDMATEIRRSTTRDRELFVKLVGTLVESNKRCDVLRSELVALLKKLHKENTTKASVKKTIKSFECVNATYEKRITALYAKQNGTELVKDKPFAGAEKKFEAVYIHPKNGPWTYAIYDVTEEDKRRYVTSGERSTRRGMLDEFEHIRAVHGAKSITLKLTTKGLKKK